MKALTSLFAPYDRGCRKVFTVLRFMSREEERLGEGGLLTFIVIAPPPFMLTRGNSPLLFLTWTAELGAPTEVG
jgi:hypothetical protein